VAGHTGGMASWEPLSDAPVPIAAHWQLEPQGRAHGHDVAAAAICPSRCCVEPHRWAQARCGLVNVSAHSPQTSRPVATRGTGWAADLARPGPQPAGKAPPAVLRTAAFPRQPRTTPALTWAFAWQVLDSNQGRHASTFFTGRSNTCPDLRLCSALPNFSGYSPRRPRSRCRPGPWRIRYEHQPLQRRPLTRQAGEAASDARAEALIPMVTERSRRPVLPPRCPATGRDRALRRSVLPHLACAAIPATQNPMPTVAMRAHPSPGAREPTPPTQPLTAQRTIRAPEDTPAHAC